MRIILLLIIMELFGCNNSTGVDSYWESQRGDFKYRNKTEFFIDTEMKNDLSVFKKVKLPLEKWIDSVYLYSWQERDPSKNEFTVIGLEGKYGPALFYVIMDKKDSLISSFRMAGTDDEGNGTQILGTVFFAKDSFNTNKQYFKGQNTDGQPEFTYSRLHVINENGVLEIIKVEQ